MPHARTDKTSRFQASGRCGMRGWGWLPKFFTAAQVNRSLGITWAGIFLPKFRLGNPDGVPALFERTDSARYELW